MLALLTMAWFVAWAHGQQETGNPTPISKTNAPEVSLDLVVHDKKNRPVMDLKPAEIAVTDNGSAVTLTSLRLVNGGSEGEHLITLLFDPLAPAMSKQARAIATAIVKMTPEKGFSLAVLLVEGRLRLQQGFTADRQALDQSVRTVTEPATPGQFDPPEKQLIVSAQTGADASGKALSLSDRSQALALLSALQGSGRMVQDQHAQPSLAGLLALVESQQQIRQRKALIYFTHGRQMDSRAREMLDSIISAANRAGVSIYVIDLNAIDRGTHQEFAQNVTSIGTVPGTVQGATGAQALPSPSQVFKDDSRAVENSGDHATENSPVKSLAEGTGGIYINGEDSLRKPLGRMIQDLTSYYKATYLPSIQEYDGKFRSIDVKPLRAGLSIRSSTGYIAMPADAGTGVRPFELPLLKILAEPKLPTDLAFHTTILRLEANRDGATLSIEAPLSDVEIREDANTKLYSAHLSIVAQIKDKTDAVLDRFAEDTPRRGALEQIEKVRSETVRWQHHFYAPAGEYILETAILDPNSGKSGAQRVAFVIPKASEVAVRGRTDSEEADAADANLDAAAIESRPTRTLAITFPATPASPPPADELKSVLADATQRAIAYSASLPNFLCIEVTNRSGDPHGQGKWKHQDSMSELLTYRDSAESRTMMEAEVYGRKSHAAREDLKGWLSRGEFGGMLKSVFAPSSKAEFQWKDSGVLGDGAIQRFNYRVAREHSTFDIHLGLQQTTVGFHGEIFIESATRSVRRITMVADDLPQGFPIQAASISVDYDYIAIHNHDYLLPVDGEVSLRLGHRQAVLNEIEFRNYRRFGSTVKVLDYTPVPER